MRNVWEAQKNIVTGKLLNNENQGTNICYTTLTLINIKIKTIKDYVTMLLFSESSTIDFELRERLNVVSSEKDVSSSVHKNYHK